MRFLCLWQASDLKLLMSKLEHWGHRLFPKMTFDELISRLEKLGQKKDVQVGFYLTFGCLHGRISDIEVYPLNVTIVGIVKLIRIVVVAGARLP